MLIAAARADVTSTWNGTAGNWTDAARWSGGVFPNNSAPNFYHAVINSGTVTLSQAVSINQITLGGGTLTGSGSITLAAGLVNTVTGTATIGGGTIFGGLGASIAVQPGATLTVLDGANFFAQVSSPSYTLSNAGTFTARNTAGPGFTTVDAVINNTGALRVENTATSHTLSLAAGGTLGGSVHLDTATSLELGGVFTIAAGTTFTGNGTVVVAGIATPGGAVTVPNLSVATGQLRLSGQTLTVANNATIGDFGTLAVEIRGIGALADRLVVGGTLATYGTLAVTLGGGFTPAVGDAFDLLDFTIADGTFATVQLPTLPAGRFWRADALLTYGTLAVSSVPATYAAWQAASGAGAFNTDDDGDGIANGIEFLLGTNPKSNASVGQPPLVELPPINGGNVTARVAFSIPEFPATDARYRLKASDDLVTWTLIASKDGAGPWSGSATVTSDAPGGGFTRITVAETLSASTVKRFHRLEAVEP